MKIGLFDSGLGGLTILRAVTHVLPQYDYIFYGDTANLPYGNKSEEEVFALTKKCVLELFSRDCALVVIACNTASAETLRALQDSVLVGEYNARRILGVIIPTVETVANMGDAKHVLLLATRRTVESGKYERELAKVAPDVRLTSVATPELVPLIEAGKTDEAVRNAEATIKATDAMHGIADTIILGCTHYTELKTGLREILEKEGRRVISQDEVIPAKLKDYLDRHPEIETRLTHTSSRSIELTEHRSDYDRLTAQLLGGGFIEDLT